jgi:hypothetical protein
MTTVYSIVPAGRAPLWFFLAIAILLIGVLGMVGATLVGSRMSRFEVSDKSLRLRGDLYGRTIPLERIVVDRARAVDLRMEPSLRPRSKRAGTALPGYSAGWFRLDNGEKALLYLTDRSRAVYIPVRDGYSLLLSPHDPEGMIADLRERARRRTG